MRLSSCSTLSAFCFIFIFIFIFGFAGCAADTVGSTTAELFEPEVHGFNFQNYGNNPGVVNLTAFEVQRMFGDAVCATGTGATCALTPTASQWLEQTSKGMAGGHCEGMAVLSLRIEQGMDAAGNYAEGAATASEIPFERNEVLQREIGYWFALQGVAPVSNAETRTTPAEVVAALEDSFEGRSSEQYTLGFYKPGYKSGHAVTPIGIAEDDDGVHILIYDNNFPGQERSIIVDEEANTWRYSAAASPDVAESGYVGDATTKTLGLTSLSVRTGALQCPFCGDYRAGTPSSRTVSVTGDAYLLIFDEAENRLGHDEEGELINEIAGASFGTSRSDDLWQDRAEPTYLVPGGSELVIEIGDGGDGSLEPSDIGVVGAGYYLGIESIVLEPGQIDTAYLGRDTAQIAYETEGLETPDIVLATETERADWIVVVRSRGDSAGQALEASLDYADGGVLNLYFEGEDEESEFDLFISRFDDTGILDFGSDMIRVPNGAALTLRFADFDEDGEELAFGVDRDGDMMPDEMIPVADVGGMPRPMGTVGPGMMGPGTMGPGATPGDGSGRDSGCSAAAPGRDPEGWGGAAAFCLFFGLLVWRRR